MKTSLSYLPQIKQEQILQAVDIIKKVANPEKIILFGSYAQILSVLGQEKDILKIVEDDKPGRKLLDLSISVKKST